LHYLTSIFLTLLFFLAGGNFAAAKNQVSSASLGDLCATKFQKEFLTADRTDSTDKIELDRQGAKNAKVLETSLEHLFRDSISLYSFSISASLGDLCALAVNSFSSPTTTDTYDANGNTTSSLLTDHGSLGTNASGIYSFDNKLIRRTTPDGKTIDLTYSPDGHRLTKFITQNGLTQRLVHYLTDANNPTGYAQVIEEKRPLDITNPLKKVNLYGHDLISTEERGTDVSPVSSIYYSYDGLGSVRSITTPTGDLQETYDYDAYGTLIGLAKRNPVTGILESSNLSSTIPDPQSEFLYTGEQWDADLGMYFLRARYLNTNTGRFHSQDSYEGRNGEPLTLHKYLYANGNPAMFTDPSGKMSILGELTTVQSFLLNFAVNFGISSIISIFSGEKISDALIDGVIGGIFGGIGGTLSKPLGTLLSKMQKPLLALAFRIIFNTAFAIASSYVDQFIDVKTGKQPDGMSKARSDMSFATALTISILGDGFRLADKAKIDVFLDYAMPILAVQAGMLSDEFIKAFENLKKIIKGRSNLIETID
jgi:RHS repeat-associated protein